MVPQIAPVTSTIMSTYGKLVIFKGFLFLNISKSIPPPNIKL